MISHAASPEGPVASGPPRCPLCGSTKATLTRTHRFAGADVATAIDFDYRYHRCSDCTAHFVHPIPDDATIAGMYDNAYYGHGSTSASPADLNSFDERLEILESLLHRRGRSLRILDVGAGPGQFLRRARDRGWQPTGVDVSHFSVEAGRAAGLEMFEGAFESAPLPAGAFDAVHAWAVFEHFRDPVLALRRAKEVLRPDGVLVIHTINIGSLNARYFGGDWECCQDAGHLVFPTEKALRKLFAREGFTVARFRSGGNPVGINRLSATTNEKGVKSAAAKQGLKQLQAAVLGNRTLRRAAKEAMHLLRLGDVLTFYVRPQIQKKTRA